MDYTTDESSDTMQPEDQIDSPSLDEDSCGGSSTGKRSLKKGPWTTTEDAILVDYVKKHGEGNWNAVQKNTGLSRCGKSCRLRWANHLKPNLKKGAFTTEEEKLIIELHARMGNKWSRMAAHIPGRTDNEIKNYWNTRIKRCKRAGLPLYPSNISFQVSNENHRSRDSGRFGIGNRKLNEFLQGNTQEAAVLFDDFKVNQFPSSYAPPFPKLLASTVLNHRLGSQNLGFMEPRAKFADRIHEGSGSLFPGFHHEPTAEILTFQRVPIDPFKKFSGDFGLGGYRGSHALLNGGISASKPLNGSDKSELPSLQHQKSISNGDLSASKPLNGSQKSELPSLQYQKSILNGGISASKSLNGFEKSELPSLQYQETDLCSWLAWSDESVHMYIDSPEQSDSVSPCNSGLLESLLHEANRLCGARNELSETSLSSSPATSGGKVDNSTLLGLDLDESLWEEYRDPISPLGCSDASLFSECSPAISGSSSDEFPPSMFHLV